MEIGNFNKEASNKVFYNINKILLNIDYFTKHYYYLTQSDNQNDGEWFINAEQFVATALTLQKVVEFIGSRPNISEALNKLRNN